MKCNITREIIEELIIHGMVVLKYKDDALDHISYDKFNALEAKKNEILVEALMHLNSIVWSSGATKSFYELEAIKFLKGINESL